MGAVRISRWLAVLAACWCGGFLWMAVATAQEAPAASSEGEKKIRQQLAEPATLEFIETPLADAMQFLRDFHQIPIEFSIAALDSQGISTDVPITRSLKGVSLRTALRLILRDLELTYMIDDDVLVITSLREAQRHAATRVYEVSALLPASEADASALAELVRQMLPPPTPTIAYDPSQPPRKGFERTVSAYHFLLVVRDTEEGHHQVEQLLARLEAGLNQAAQGEAARRGLPARPQPAPGAPVNEDPFGGGDPFAPPSKKSGANDPFGAVDLPPAK